MRSRARESINRSKADISEYRHIVIADRDADEKNEKSRDVRESFDDPAAPLEIDIGSGKGRFLVARAALCPDVNFLGIERQYARVWKTARKIERAGLTNVRLARVEAFEGIGELVPPGSLATVYIFFPDPWPKRRHHRRRLVNSEFMDMLHNRLVPGGVVHFATDHDDYAAAVTELFRADERFAEIEPFIPSDDERTDFELIFTGQGKAVNRISINKI